MIGKIQTHTTCYQCQVTGGKLLRPAKVKNCLSFFFLFQAFLDHSTQRTQAALSSFSNLFFTDFRCIVCTAQYALQCSDCIPSTKNSTQQDHGSQFTFSAKKHSLSRGDSSNDNPTLSILGFSRKNGQKNRQNANSSSCYLACGASNLILSLSLSLFKRQLVSNCFEMLVIALIDWF